MDGQNTGGFQHATRDVFFEKAEARRRQTEDVDFPELGLTITFQELKGSEVDAYQKGRVKVRGNEQEYDTANSRAVLFALGAVNPDGTRMFNPAAHTEIARLNKLPNVILDRGASVVSRLSGMDKDAVKQAGEASGGDQTANSSSD